MHNVPQSSLVFSIYFILCPLDLRSEHWRNFLGTEVSHIKNIIIKKKNTAALVKFNLKLRHKVLQSKFHLRFRVLLMEFPSIFLIH